MSAAADEVADTLMLLRDELMAKHTSWRVGGPADVFFKPSTLDQLESFFATLPDEQPVHFIGLGSNLLVRDGGIRGAVICTSALPREVSRLDEVRVRAAAGLPCTTLARRCARWKLGPAAFFAGIPGTVGGALAMNAGAFGGETWNNVESVTTIDRSGVLHVRPRRSSPAPTARSRAPQTSGSLARRSGSSRTSDPLRRRSRRCSASAPTRSRSAGRARARCFAIRPGNFAGRLIERAGLKGARVGGALSLRSTRTSS